MPSGGDIGAAKFNTTLPYRELGTQALLLLGGKLPCCFGLSAAWYFATCELEEAATQRIGPELTHLSAGNMSTDTTLSTTVEHEETIVVKVPSNKKQAKTGTCNKQFCQSAWSRML